MFTGDAVGRRVNLGGSRQLVDKQSLIEKQRIERLEREKMRNRIDACTTIQSWWRGWRARRIIGQEYARRFSTSLIQNDFSWSLKYLWACVLVGKTDLVVDHNELIDFAIRISSTDFPSILYLCALMVTAKRELLIRLITSVPPPLVSKIFRNIDPVAIFTKIDNDQIVDTILNEIDSLVFPQGLIARFEKFSTPIREPILQRLCLLPIHFGFPTSHQANENMVMCLSSMITNPKNFPSWENLATLIGNIGYPLSPNSQQTIVEKCLLNNRSVPSNHSFLHLLNFSKFSEDEIFQIVTSSNTCQVIANSLIVDLRNEFLIFQPNQFLEQRVESFTILFSAIVLGVHASSSSIVNTSTVEALFPLLNRFGYRRIVDSSAARYEPLFALIRAIYDKKFLFTKLRSETVWVIPESVHQIPPNLNSFDIIDRLRREQEEDEDMPEHPQISPQFTSAVFETMIEKMPHIVPFTDRVRILASALAEDKRNHYISSRGLGFPQRTRAYLKRVRRDELLEDGMSIFSSSPESLKDILQIEFISKENTIEAGIDGGGLFKEFLHSWIKELMNPDFGLFQQLVNGRLSPNPNAYRLHANPDKYFSALGRAVAKALYEMVLLETHLGESFLDRIIGRSYSLEQLAEIDESLYKNLKFVATDCEDVDNLALTFAVSSPSHETIDLVPGGASIAVSESNKIKYVLLASWVYLARQLEKPAAAFASGFNEIVPISWLRMFSPREINMLISGEQREGFDVEDLKANVVYGGGYRGDSETVRIFWEVVKEMELKDQSAFLQFVTSSPRSPLLGFRVMHPKFAINRVPEPDRLPTASTCNNLFKLPDYKDKRVLREKLLLALYAHGGFDLS